MVVKDRYTDTSRWFICIVSRGESLQTGVMFRVSVSYNYSYKLMV